MKFPSRPQPAPDTKRAQGLAFMVEERRRQRVAEAQRAIESIDGLPPFARFRLHDDAMSDPDQVLQFLEFAFRDDAETKFAEQVKEATKVREAAEARVAEAQRSQPVAAAPSDGDTWRTVSFPTVEKLEEFMGRLSASARDDFKRDNPDIFPPAHAGDYADDYFEVTNGTLEYLTSDGRLIAAFQFEGRLVDAMSAGMITKAVSRGRVAKAQVKNRHGEAIAGNMPVAMLPLQPSEVAAFVVDNTWINSGDHLNLDDFHDQRDEHALARALRH